jgi:hypothetical protein
MYDLIFVTLLRDVSEDISTLVIVYLKIWTSIVLADDYGYGFENWHLWWSQSWRASSKVCYILLSKSCDLLTPKTIWGVKKEHLSKCLVFWTWQNEKKKAHKSFKVFLIHQPPARSHACMEKSRPGVTHAWKNRDGKPSTHAYICACRGEICQVAIDAKLFCQTIGGYFLLFC